MSIQPYPNSILWFTRARVRSYVNIHNINSDWLWRNSLEWKDLEELCLQYVSAHCIPSCFVSLTAIFFCPLKEYEIDSFRFLTNNHPFLGISNPITVLIYFVLNNVYHQFISFRFQNQFLIFFTYNKWTKNKQFQLHPIVYCIRSNS